MKKKLLISAFAGIAIYLMNTAAVAQEPLPSPRHMSHEDSVAINALALYPENIRINIFEACEYPAAIVNISSLQKTTSSQFANLIGEYSKEEQEDLWNMSRYPNLITDIVSGGKKSKADMDAIVARYPEDIRETAIRSDREHFQILKQMDEIQQQTNQQFASIISDFPRGTQDALNALIQYPEIINILNDNLNMAVRIGDHYRRDPQRVIAWVDGIALAEARQNAQDAADWKKTLEENPDAANELQSAAADYAQENGYTQEEINYEPDPDYVANYTCAPYSYWFGYPTWYPYSYWYPYPFWFDCGFYHNHGGGLVFMGPPSFYFTNWFFYHPEFYQRYPHLGGVYVNHYYGARRSYVGNGRVVNNWVSNNRRYLPNDFTSNRANRVEAIRQVGKMNEEVQKQNGGRPVTNEMRDQYVQKNATKYPALNTRPEPMKEGAGRQQGRTENLPRPENQPHVIIPKQSQPAQRPSEPAQHQSERPAQQSRQQNNNFNNINRAQEYNRNSWEQSQHTTRPQASPAPRSSAPSRPSGGGGGSHGGGGRR